MISESGRAACSAASNHAARTEPTFIEYIVPVPAWPHAEPPEILGQALHLNPVQNIWALHVWIGRHNPAGMFADWNPDVSCQFAPPPGD